MPSIIMMESPLKKSFLQKQIPTILGLGVLVLALVAGIFLVGSDTISFAPRATPETTPQNIKLTNVTDNSFTVSFYTSEATAGFVKYGTKEGELKSQSSDDRDQLSGTVGQYTLHHITIRGLSPGTDYFYVLGTGSRSTFDNNGGNFKVKTATKGGAPGAAKTVYGNIVTASNSPADGAIVYLSLPGIGEMSSLVKSSGSWAIPLSNARKSDGSGYATISESDQMSLNVVGPDNSKSTLSVSVSSGQPVANITLGSNELADSTSMMNKEEATNASASAAAGKISTRPDLITDDQEATTSSIATVPQVTNQPTLTGGTSTSSAGLLGKYLGPPATGTASSVLDITTLPIVKPVLPPQPKFTAKVKPNTVVNIKINSETQISQEVTSDANGDFEIDLEELKKTLEPGEHTITYSYTDPDTGELVEKTIEFTVEAPTQLASSSESTTQQIALASPSPTPFGSGNPYSLTSPSPTAATSTATSSSSKGGVATRSAMPGTGSAIPTSGSVATTYTLIFAGLFFLLAGVWSYYLSIKVEELGE